MTPNASSASVLPFLEEKDTRVRRILGCRLDKPKMGTPLWKERHGVLSRADWDQDLDFRRDADIQAPVLNQGGTSACVGFASATAFALAWQLQHHNAEAAGLRFSPWFVYGNINGGVDEGSSVGEALDSLHTVGICRNDEVPEGTLFNTAFSSGAFDTAKGFRIEQAILCPSFDEIATAIQLTSPVVIAIHPGQGFQDCRFPGILPDRTGAVGSLGHAMCALGLKLIDNEWHLLVQNSYSEIWGDVGFGYMPESYFPASENLSWAIKAVSDAPSF
jgi:hypothetical protein